MAAPWKTQAEIEATVAAGQWIIYTLHGVGAGTHTYFLDADVHGRLTEWLGAQRARIWTAPMIEVAQHLLQFDKSITISITDGGPPSAVNPHHRSANYGTLLQTRSSKHGP